MTSHAGDVTVRHAGRNSNYSRSDAFVKHLVGPDADRRVRNTLFFDSWQRTHGLGLSPAVLSHEGSTVEFELIEAATPLLDHASGHSDTGVPDLVGRRCEAAGALLGRLHRCALPGEPDTFRVPDLRRAMAPFTAIDLDRFLRASAAELECWRMFHHDVELREGLAQYAAEAAERPHVPIHGDLRVDQFVCSPSEGMYLVDWEEFGIGAAEVDVAAACGSLLYDAVLTALGSLRAQENSILGQHTAITDTIVRALSDRSPLVRAFLHGHASAGPVVSLDLVGRGIGYFFIGRTIARASLGAQLSSVDRAIAGVGRQAVVDPESTREVFAPIAAERRHG